MWGCRGSEGLKGTPQTRLGPPDGSRNVAICKQSRRSGACAAPRWAAMRMRRLAHQVTAHGSRLASHSPIRHTKSQTQTLLEATNGSA